MRPGYEAACGRRGGTLSNLDEVRRHVDRFLIAMTTSMTSLTRTAVMRVRVTACLAMIACAGTGLAVAGCGGASAMTGPPQRAANRFLATYLRPDGRVIRLDQGGDTVSEGQAYGMLLAEATGNHDAFGRIWRWTREHLQLPDGLFAWHASAAGKRDNSQPASDADLLIAWALLRYQGPGQGAWHRDGRRVAAAVQAHEVTTGPGGVLVLAAGPWATGRPASLNPSYWALPAFSDLARLTGNHVWHRLAAGAVTLMIKLTGDGHQLPPDWAALTSGGALRPEPAPDGSQPQTQYGPDAQRAVAWFAASCDPKARALAARWWPLLRRGGASHATALQPDGAVLDPAAAPLALVASAAAAKAAGNGATARKRLRQAASEQRSHATYYGGAWAALGSALLTTGALGTCH
jgi:endo-1,4-beta-D-glucanase Y